MIRPVQVSECKYIWDEIEIRPSKCMGGFGVFAKKNLPPGLMIPIVGHIVHNSQLHARNISHVWKYSAHSYLKGYSIDGHPSRDTFGLAIAMFINESSHKRMNCISRIYSECVIVAQNIKKDEELTFYYGSRYERKGYSVEHNKHLRPIYPWYQNTPKDWYPTVKERNILIKELNDIIIGCTREQNTHQNPYAREFKPRCRCLIQSTVEEETNPYARRYNPRHRG
jgi:hypothetical protein